MDPATAVPTQRWRRCAARRASAPSRRAPRFQDELLQAQIEVATPVCWSRPLARERRPAAVRRPLRVREPS
ncbi:hypothetical protein MBT42_00980 [Streptomyces sp. MBT42]|nr:hypothetical protein [Streptomyces sp. MBT42]